MNEQNNEHQEKSTLVSRNVTVMGKRTSVRLEPEMWAALKDIASIEQCTIHDVCTLIKMRKKPMTSLTAAIRVFIMLYYRAASTDMGHKRAGHGSFYNMLERAKVKTCEQDQHYLSKFFKRPIAVNDLGSLQASHC